MKKKTHSEFVKQINDLYGDSVKILGTYKTSQDKILVKFTDCGCEEYKNPQKLLLGQMCSKHYGNRISQSKVKSQSKAENELKNLGCELLSKYNGNHEKVKVKNLNCNHIYFAKYGNIVRGSGCPICHGNKDTNSFIETIDKLYPNEYKVLGKYVNNRTKILVKHLKCGHEWFVIPKDILRDRRCPKCMSSKGELYISMLLENNGIQYSTQYKIKECKDKKPLPFDFMIEINGVKKLIEFDGSQHYKTNSWGRESKTMEHDKIKNDYCEANNIPLLRIPYWWLRNDRAKREIISFLFN